MIIVQVSRFSVLDLLKKPPICAGVPQKKAGAQEPELPEKQWPEVRCRILSWISGAFSFEIVDEVRVWTTVEMEGGE